MTPNDVIARGKSMTTAKIEGHFRYEQDQAWIAKALRTMRLEAKMPAVEMALALGRGREKIAFLERLRQRWTEELIKQYLQAIASFKWHRARAKKPARVRKYEPRRLMRIWQKAIHQNLLKEAA